MKSRGRKTAKVKRHEAPTVERRRGYSAANLQEQLDQRTRERDEARKLHAEALEQQTATSEVLQVISSTPGELGPVFRTILTNATRICEAKFASLYLYDGAAFHASAFHNAPAAFVEERRRRPIRPHPESGLGRVALTKQVAQVADIKATPPYIERDPFVVAGVELGNYRTVLTVPMLKENDLIGAINICQQEVRPFTDKQIELVRNFAAQAVIAIENTRLLNELRQRTDDLTELLEQQTATSEVLQVISSSPGELEPVFEAMLAKATDICEAKFGVLWQAEGWGYRAVAMHGVPSAYSSEREREPVIYPEPEIPLGRLAQTKQVLQISDIRNDESYIKGFPPIVNLADNGGARTLLMVPMLKEHELIGAIAIYRKEVRPFTDKQIELVQNFAAQAVIAIENTRLLNELRQRTDDLSEALEQQTATSEVLRVISTSPGKLEAVFEALLANAVRVIGSTFGTMYLRQGDLFRVGAVHGAPPAYVETLKSDPLFRPGAETVLGRVARTKEVMHVPNLLVDEAYRKRGPRVVAAVEQGGVQALLSVPMLKDNELVGTITIYRAQTGSFTDKQIELVTNFAAQAVIAIENTRLLNELRESLQQQTATADVLKVISRSTFELQPVFDSMAESAVRLCEAEQAYIFRFDGQVLRAVASFNAGPENQDWVYRNPIPLGRHSVSARAGLERRTVQVADIQADPEYTYVARDVDPIRTTLAVPMLKDDELIGTITIYRLEVKPFTENQISLMETFADQAVIAIENARLFENVQTRTRELAKSLEDLRTAQDRLVQTEKLASLGQLTAGIAHEIKNPLNFVNNFSAVSVELIDELREALSSAHLDSKLRAEISEIADMLQGNLDKVVQHGKRADSIVKNMLLHSRQGSGEHRPVDINALVEESLNLAYHGARAEKQGFNITMEKSFDPAAGEVDVFPQEITRVLLNLISNGFYAATKRKAEVGDGSYEPALAASTKNLGDRVEIRIRDNGTGIPPEVREKMFNPFFTTKPAGEGTGLGLSISHDIIVKQHGGSIEFDTKPGEFTEFKIVLPRGAATIAKLGERN